MIEIGEKLPTSSCKVADPNGNEGRTAPNMIELEILKGWLKSKRKGDLPAVDV